ncbi:ATP synthase subunit C [Candidatus Endoriftia persephonae]|jgi:V/A-type H+-transporting ATPase subunit K|uniref:ATPase subunit C n=4 Tax=Gammaproteobacteria TaxID=1236 RepID=G2FC15_9GAMM|nr:ATP synthase subunit C [Candidatus Endoriftia persephone]EGV52028.1 H+-transporting two-sector ATPase, C subunit [endosymbiont of Riftia pachyptila (vent Ph05)]EGW55846.1 ATPase subunit C [endosymbiont of Tevnia jerichonana (vent Tica)]KRT54902.1 ATP synthase subunit C [endosymbiont of Ridgeia piscesae]KRT60033.1 V/A-type H+-transporting ATPase subunit K [endosymbiont of Ridgeia piscesae]USF86184.1 ATP synthase subunit C [Candidatus Endoriftia persephone]
MYLLIGVMTLGIVGLIVAGILMEMRPARTGQRWFKPTIVGNLLLFVVAQAALIFIGAQEVMAAPAVAESGGEISIGMGLAIIGIGIPTALSTIAAGIAVGPIGAASLAVLAEKPEIFGRTLVYLGLAEGIAIYGLVMSILLLDKI